MAQNKIYRALGLMSGTSLDGVDGAICITDGVKIIGFEGTHFRPYTASEQTELRQCLGKWPQDNTLGDAQDIIATAHLEVINALPDCDLVGFHGQTLSHDPDNERTFQLGDGATLAKECGKTVVWDFRSADMKAGGQGAPLAPFFHFACAKVLGLKTPVAFVNLGGVGNVTVVDPSKPTPESDGALLAFDTGPANAPINDFMKSRLKLDYDADGALAQSGIVSAKVLESLFEHDYFEQGAPKSLDRDDFSKIKDAVTNLSDADAVATLTSFAASCVYAAQMHFNIDPERWLICGGGRRNTALMNALRDSMAKPVDAVEVVGFDGDMFEAQAFGYLAARVINGLPTSAPSTTGCSEPICGGRISAPS